MWQEKKISVILPTYREKDSIGGVIRGLFELGVVDEVVVVDNNAEEGTLEEVSRVGSSELIKVVSEDRQGYGFACQKGLREASGDYLILTEPDGTFLPEDILKLLAYSEFDVVFGSRTRTSFIWEGAKMGFLLRTGNWAVAKLIQVLFNTPSITDVGCTLRLIKRPLYEEIYNHFTVGGNHFSPEMMILVFLRKEGFRSVEVPVNFLPRVGQSRGTPTLWVATLIALRMILLTLRYRIMTIFKP